jgi:hypothetical protein
MFISEKVALFYRIQGAKDSSELEPSNPFCSYTGEEP